MKVTDDSLTSKLPSWESKRVKTSDRPSGCCGLDAFHHRVQAKRNSVTYGTIGHKVLVVFYQHQTLILWMRKRLLKRCTEGFACTRENKQTRLPQALGRPLQLSHGFFGGSGPERPQIPRCILFQHDIALVQHWTDRQCQSRWWFLPIKYLQQQIEVLSFQVPILPSLSELLRLLAEVNLLLKAVSMRFTCTIAFFCTSSQPKEPHTPYPLNSTKPSKSVPCTPLICNSCRLADNTVSKIEEDSNMSWTQLRKPQKHRGNRTVSSLGGHVAGSQQGRHGRAATGGRLAGKLMQLWTA